jgi:hypothetical protein
MRQPSTIAMDVGLLNVRKAGIQAVPAKSHRMTSDCFLHLYHLQEKYAESPLPLGIRLRIWWKSIHTQFLQARESMSKEAPTGL